MRKEKLLSFFRRSRLSLLVTTIFLLAAISASASLVLPMEKSTDTCVYEEGILQDRFKEYVHEESAQLYRLIEVPVEYCLSQELCEEFGGGLKHSGSSNIHELSGMAIETCYVIQRYVPNVRGDDVLDQQCSLIETRYSLRSLWADAVSANTPGGSAFSAT